MSDLKSRIVRLIEAQGPISIAQFMTMALLDSRAGYYATRDPFGAEGDFITAPEVSQMFGELVGLWMVQCWLEQGSPSPARLVELGPGRGTLMADALRTAKIVPEFLDAVEIVLVEASPALHEIQRGNVPDARWLDHFDSDLLGERPLFLIANEFFDALPIRQYVKTERGWCERMVTAKDGELAFALAPVASQIAADDTEDGAVYETSPASIALVEEISGIVADRGGAALIIDYGHHGGFGDTLQAVAKHKYASILDAPGEADLSAHVDFSALAAAAKRGGASAFGPVDQGAFLNALGLQQRALTLIQNNPREQKSIEAAIDRLAVQMGTLFKALAISSGKPPGF